MKKINLNEYTQCDEDEFERTPKKDKMSVCVGEKYEFFHFRKKKRLKKKGETKMNKELKSKLWKKSKPSGEYPKDWYVIPVLDVIELIEMEKTK